MASAPSTTAKIMRLRIPRLPSLQRSCIDRSTPHRAEGWNYLAAAETLVSAAAGMSGERDAACSLEALSDPVVALPLVGLGGLGRALVGAVDRGRRLGECEDSVRD